MGGIPSMRNKILQVAIEPLASEIPYASAEPYAFASADPERKIPVRRPSRSRG